MGRKKSSTIKGSLRLKYPKKGYDENKEYTLYYEYIWNRQIIRRDTLVRVRVKDWNENANKGIGELRSGFGAAYKKQNTLLYEMLQKVDANIIDYITKHPDISLTPQIVHDILFGAAYSRDDEGQDFVEFVKENLKARLNANKIKRSRYENGLSAMKIFKEFLNVKGKGTYKPDSIYLGEITGALLDDYIDYRKNIKHNSNATINHTLTPIIIACENAQLRGYISGKTYAEIKEKRLVEDAANLNDEGFDGKYLSLEQIKKLVDFYEVDTEKRRKEYIEMYLFAFHAGGLRLVDVMTLQWKNIDFEKKEMKKVLIKTVKYQKQRHTVPLTEPALRILYKWQEIARIKRQEGFLANFVFDLVDEATFDITSQESIYFVRNTVDKKINQALKVVGAKIGLPFSLTFHSARHSFAINALNDKNHPLSMYQVSRLLGHSSTETTEKVYAEFTSETLTKEMEALNYNFVPSNLPRQE